MQPVLSAWSVRSVRWRRGNGPTCASCGWEGDGRTLRRPWPPNSWKVLGEMSCPPGWPEGSSSGRGPPRPPPVERCSARPALADYVVSPHVSKPNAMKNQRRAMIMEIVRRTRVHSQEQLRELLHAEGIDATQATLSRDIRELRLSKLADPGGGSYYAPGRDGDLLPPPLDQLLPALLLAIEGVGP